MPTSSGPGYLERVTHFPKVVRGDLEPLAMAERKPSEQNALSETAGGTTDGVTTPIDDRGVQDQPIPTRVLADPESTARL
eukprot:8708011-Lingulodinium_polyedra.AAC.1